MIMSVMPFSKAHRYAEPLPSERILKEGKASWYSRKSPGIRHHTAKMEIFDDEAFTSAMWGAKFNQKLRVLSSMRRLFLSVKTISMQYPCQEASKPIQKQLRRKQ